MSSSLIITLEIAGVLGFVLVWGGWELWSLRRDRLREEAQARLARDGLPQRAHEDASALKKDEGVG